MDPYAALKQLDVDLDDRNNEGVFDRAEALIGWLRAGGFNPFDKRIGTDWRANLTRSEIVQYLYDIAKATGVDGR